MSKESQKCHNNLSTPQSEESRYQQREENIILADKNIFRIKKKEQMIKPTSFAATDFF